MLGTQARCCSFAPETTNSCQKSTREFVNLESCKGILPADTVRMLPSLDGLFLVWKVFCICVQVSAQTRKTRRHVQEESVTSYHILQKEKDDNGNLSFFVFRNPDCPCLHPKQRDSNSSPDLGSCHRKQFLLFPADPEMAAVPDHKTAERGALADKSNLQKPANPEGEKAQPKK